MAPQTEQRQDLEDSPTSTGGELHSGDAITEAAAPGSLACAQCGFAVTLEALDAVPSCPGCGGTTFNRARIFSATAIDVATVEPPEDAPEWLSEAREHAAGSPHLAVRDGEETHLVALRPGWIRIGRSASADVTLDDPTVSRRHSLVVMTDEGELRALDDRSLNGLFVNGERVEWAPLTDGDELEIGRYRIVVLS